LPQIVATLRRLVELESPSNHKAAVDRLGAFVAGEFERRGARVRLHRQQVFGDHLQADFPGAGKPVLLLGHIDTVWDVGTLARMPLKEADGRLWGPGVLDMKAGIALMLHALDVLRERGVQRALTALLVTDEEIGSNSSRALTERLARKSAAVLIPEPAAGLHGALKTARKGVGEFHLKVTGRAAHSGLDFEKGHSAVLELARQLLEIAKFTDLKRGVTVNPGVIRGGTRVNVIAAEAAAEVDARIARLSDGPRLERRFRALKPFDKNCKLEVSGGIARPPMERRACAALFAQAKTLAGALGFELQEEAVGGGSDGNFTAARGVPTLDGLGGVGEGAHAANESIVVAELPRRAALLVRLVEKL
jgi:glutamate carboxypeptidase